jgi:hypothetical protein
MRRFAPVIVLALGSVTALACSSSPNHSSSSGAGGGGGACGLAFFPSDYPTSCQPALDQICCAQEQACGGNADCANLVKCVNACPPPRQDSCVAACSPADGGTPPGYDLLSAIADCNNASPPPDGGSASCNWPN